MMREGGWPYLAGLAGSAALILIGHASGVRTYLRRRHGGPG